MSVAIAPYEFRADVTVCVDFLSPHAFLAVAPTRALEATLGREFDWLPFSAPPLFRPAPVGPDDDRGTRHRRIRAHYFERDLARYAAARGIALGNLHRNVDASLAESALLWRRARSASGLSAWVERIFAALWLEERDITDPATVAAIFDADLATLRAYADGQGGRLRAELQERLSAAGVFNVPAYVLRGGETFFGRQHLPLIEALVSRT